MGDQVISWKEINLCDWINKQNRLTGLYRNIIVEINTVDIKGEK